MARYPSLCGLPQSTEISPSETNIGFASPNRCAMTDGHRTPITFRAFLLPVSVYETSNGCIGLPVSHRYRASYRYAGSLAAIGMVSSENSTEIISQQASRHSEIPATMRTTFIVLSIRSSGAGVKCSRLVTGRPAITVRCGFIYALHR